VNRLICTAPITMAAGSAARVAEAESPPPSCFSSLWDYFESSIRDCPLSYGPIMVYGTVDAGVGYEQWGEPLGTYADKPNYAIQRSSGNTHWLWSPNALSTSTIGVRLTQEVAKNWEVIGVAEAGFNPYTLRLINGPQSLADNNPLTPANQTTHLDSARAGTWDNGQGFIGISNSTYGTLTFGRTVLLSQSALGAYDPVASFAFSQIGFSAQYSTLWRNAGVARQHRDHLSSDLQRFAPRRTSAGRRLQSGQRGDPAISSSGRNRFSQIFIRRGRRLCS
jgi:hypothetical protein